jgi:hypothetical protein
MKNVFRIVVGMSLATLGSSTTAAAMPPYMTDKKQWLYRWKNWLMPSPVPGVWNRKEGGQLVRTRVMDPTTGRMKEIRKVMPEADLGTAFKWLQDERARVQAGLVLFPPPQHRFGDYANSLLERKMNTGEVRSAKGREKWRCVLEHLIAGTEGKKSGLFVPGFGEFFIDKLDVPHVEAWREGMGTLIRGRPRPSTAGWPCCGSS